MSSRRVESFLLRLVVEEPRAPEGEAWRGRIQHVSSGSERQFDHMQDMLTFISQQLVSQQSFVLSFNAPASLE